MQRQILLISSVALSAFVAGFLLRGAVSPLSQPDPGDDGALGGAEGIRAEVKGTDKGVLTAVLESRSASPEHSLSTRQLETVLTMFMNDLETVFVEMNLSDSQIQRLQSGELLEEMRDSLHSIELRHVSLVENQEESYIEISPFPGDRREWIDSIEERVREIVDDERTPIITRALMARNGLLDSGILRRQLSFFDDLDGKLQLSERRFGSDGICIREDTGPALPEDAERWGVRLELETELSK